ncbi:MAG: hemerythrin domain-containing protein [Promethearchaeota archaeon]|jgi:iron-sulfur cluster repair protein YtfE (RIC family)
MTPPRYDVYGPVHKGIRFLMTEIMFELGNSDVNNSSELSSLEVKLQFLWDILKVHAEGEEEFIFPVLENENKSIFNKLKLAHEKFEEQIDIFRKDFPKIVGMDKEIEEKGDKLSKFTKQYNTFLSQYFSHLQDEELEANPILWNVLNNNELMDIINKIAAKLTPEERQRFMPYFLRAINHPERLGLLMGMKRNMPEPIFKAILNMAQASLEKADWQKLKQSLDNLVQVH